MLGHSLGRSHRGLALPLALRAPDTGRKHAAETNAAKGAGSLSAKNVA
jgi:hypothetical protein